MVNPTFCGGPRACCPAGTAAPAEAVGCARSAIGGLSASTPRVLHSKFVVDPRLDTASQRPPTGLDAAARRLIFTATEAPPAHIVAVFFRDTYADYDDYSRAVAEVWGLDEGQMLYSVVDSAMHGDAMLLGSRSPDDVASALLEHMPEPDFRVAIAKAYSILHASAATLDASIGLHEQEERITQICRSRRAPWSFTIEDGFVWTGDEEIEALAIIPALTALADARFAGGVKAEFESARQELSVGVPTALSKSVQQSGAAVESAMKVVLDELGIAYRPDRDTAFVLFDHLKDNGVIENFHEGRRAGNGHATESAGRARGRATTSRRTGRSC